MSTSTTINGLQHYLPDTSDVEWGGLLSSYLHGLSYAKHGALAFYGSSGLVAVTTKYIVPGYAALTTDAVAVPSPMTGRIAAAYANYSGTGGVGPNTAVAFEITGPGGSIGTATILALALTGTFTISAGSVTAGDALSVTCTPAVGFTNSGSAVAVTIILVPL